MKVIKIWKVIFIIGANKDDMKHMYIRQSLSNHDVKQAMGEGFGDKKLPKSSYGCQFAHIFTGIWR